MGSFSPHLEKLPKSQFCLWPELRPAVDLGFVLYGGTAVALRLGHRTSVDFDFFTEQPLRRPAIERAFSFLDKAEVLQDTPNTFTVLVQPDANIPSTVKLSFFGDIIFGRVRDPEWTADRVVQVASVDDLLATKLKVLLQRLEAKDYIDIAALLRGGISLERGLAGARALFGTSFQPSECLKALVYFEGGDLDTLPQATRDFLIRAAGAVRDLPHILAVEKQLTLR